MLERAKTQLLNSGESISNIASDLGFKYPQNLSKLVKKKTRVSSSQFRNVKQTTIDKEQSLHTTTRWMFMMAKRHHATDATDT